MKVLHLSLKRVAGLLIASLAFILFIPLFFFVSLATYAHTLIAVIGITGKPPIDTLDKYPILTAPFVPLGLVYYPFQLYGKRVDQALEEKLRALPPVNQWPSYTDKQHSLTFHYPAGWTVDYYQPENSSTPPTLRIRSELKGAGKISAMGIFISDSQYFRDDCTLEETTEHFARKLVHINNLQFIRRYATYTQSRKETLSYCLLNENPPILFELSNHYQLEHSPSLANQAEKLLNQIMSTMKKNG